MNKDQGGELIIIQGIKCYLPPVPDRYDIQNFDKPKKLQKWERTPLPEFRAADVDLIEKTDYKSDDVISWEEACRIEHIRIYGTDPLNVDRNGTEKKVDGVIPDPDYSMERLNPFRDQELGRIKNGHWIYVNGKPLYLTGNYYFYLNYWQLKDGYPEFRIPDMELFYFWESVKNSRNLFGIIYITIRGCGKSFIAGCINYYSAITKRKANTTIQSQSDDKAAEFFRDKVLLPVTSLPEFLVPINKHGKSDITNNSTLEFVPAARKGMPMRVYQHIKKIALYSKMQYSNASETGADGGTWDLIVGEEVGKTDPSVSNVYKRQQVNLFAVFRANKKLGNIYLSSTVEEMKEGGAECKKIWDESNHYNLNVAGSTNMGLARIFRSALDATFFDEFGYPVPHTDDKQLGDYLADKYGEEARHGAKAFHDAKRKSLEHDQQALIGYKQKNPYTEEEAFWINAEKCIYNAEILLNAKERIMNSGKQLTRRGDIVWKEKDKEAQFVDNKFGKWEVSFFNFEPNMVQVNEGTKSTFTPKAAHKRIMAIDPYSVMSLADEKSGSNGAAAVFNRHDIHAPVDFCDTIIADYVSRPKDPFDFYEDMICAAFFFGCPMFVETNKSNITDYFRTRGYKWGYDANPNDFVWERPVSTLTKYSDKVTDGMYQSQGTIEHYTNSTARHIIDHGWKLKHLRVIDDWLIFDPLKTRKFDLGVAASMAIVGAERPAINVAPEIDLSDIMPTFDNSGSYSVQN